MKIIFVSVILVCITLTGFSQHRKFNISLNTGIFSKDFNWSIAGNMEGKNPNVLSELVWESLSGVYYNISSNYSLTSRIIINANFTYGKISEGKVNDADYLEDNRKQPVFDESFLSNKGHYQNASLNLCLRRDLTDRISLNALFGYDNLIQKLYLLEDPEYPTDGNLNSYYKNFWNGLQAGFDVSYLLGKFTVYGKVRAGYYKYYANANWNLVANFKKPISFEQKANAYKYSGGLHLSYAINKIVEVSSGLNFDYGASLAGKDYAYFTDNSTAITKFNGAELKSRYFELGLNLTF